MMFNAFQARISSKGAAPSGAAQSSAQSALGQQAIGEDSRTLAMAIAQAADDRKGIDIVLLKVSEVSYIADYFVLASGYSGTQVRAIARSIQDKLETEYQRLPVRVEGQVEGSWILIDYGDVIAHIFLPKEREFYGLEAFWGHAERTKFAPVAHSAGDSLQ